MITEIKKTTIYYVDTERDGDHYWTEWRTNKEGTHWENLMGMSWECIDPPQKLIDEFLEKMNGPL